MIKAHHTFLGKVFFNYYSNIKLKRHFRTVRYVGEFIETDLPILIIANHFSWWDGFIQLQLNNRFMKRIFHVMMLEDQLSRFIILNKGGAFSIKKNSRDMIGSLNYSVKILSDKNNLLLLFPQGEIQSLYTENFCFKPGLMYLLKNTKNGVQIVFNINLIDYFSEEKAGLTVYFKAYTFLSGSNLKEIEAAFNLYARECKILQIVENK